MVILNNYSKNISIFLFTIFLIISLPITTVLLTSNQIRFTNDESSTDEFDPQIPEESDVYYKDMDGSAWNVYVSGDYAYVASASYGLAIINISDPTTPGTPIYEDTIGSATGVYVSGDYAYVADYGEGLAVINISDPTNPGIPINENTTGDARDVFISGDFAYMACYDTGLAIINISDPTNPGTPVYKDTNGLAWSVYVSGDYAYVADHSSGLAVIDISDPTNPGTPIYENTDGSAYGVYVSGNYAYIADDSLGLAIIDISDPTDPGTPVYEDTAGFAHDVSVSGNYAYVADYPNGLAVINITNPTDPGMPDYEDTNGDAYGLYVNGNYAYVAIQGGGLAVIDIAEQITPGTTFYEDATGSAYDVCVSGDYAYVAAHSSGLAVFNISNPTNPEEPEYSNTDGVAFGVYVSGDYAYVADYEEGLAIINISDPTNPGTPINENTTGGARNVFVSGDYAYIADSLSGLAVIDISDPTNPETPIYKNTDGTARAVFVSGNYAYIADSLSGLAVIDISDPTKPGEPVYADTNGNAFDVYISGDYAYVADYGSGLAIINITKPTKPETLIYENTDGSAMGVYVDGDYAYVADYQDGLAIINITKPTNPETLVCGNVAGHVYKVYVDGDYTYIADGSPGLATIQVRQRINMGEPIITDFQSDLTVKTDYTEQSITWTATDVNPYNYTIELQGSGIVAGSTAWTSGEAIIYNIPEDFPLGDYVYTVNFTDDVGNYITHSMTFTVSDIIKPEIQDPPSDLIMETDYTGQNISWTAADLNPYNYTIELQGSGIKVESTNWTSGQPITYDIPEDFPLGDYVYTVNFTDDGGNFKTDSVIFTVSDIIKPEIQDPPSDLIMETDYTGQNISWTAADLNPYNYTIVRQGSGIVVESTAWTSGQPITYDIPEGFALGDYIYTVNFTDDGGNFKTDSVIFTVSDTLNPIITDFPSDLTVETDYTGQSISWNATDLNPYNYTIELQGSGIVVESIAWSSGTEITYNIPDGLAVGVYTYTVNFTDDGGNSITDSVTFTVGDPINPSITDSPSDITVKSNYTGQTISWTATELNPNTYTIELNGSGIVAGPTVWSSGVAITFDIPDNLSVGVYVYTITFIDKVGNSITDSMTFTVEAISNGDDNSKPPGASFGTIMIISASMFSAISIFIATAIVIVKKKKLRSNPV